MNRLRELLDKASPAPWTAEVSGGPFDSGCITNAADHVVCLGGHDWDNYGEMSNADAELIVELRNAAPKLLAVVEAARAFYPTTISDDQHSDEGHALWDALSALEDKS